jgi:hypothetical protein
MYTTEEMIEKIVAAVAGTGPASRQSYFLRESLRHLVRIAQCERESDIKRCVALSLGETGNANARRISKAATRKLLTTLKSSQGRLDFQPRISG